MTSLLGKYNKSIQVKCIVKQGRRNWGGGRVGYGGGMCPTPLQFLVTLMCPFSNYTYVSFPNLILWRVPNYWLGLIYDFTVSSLLKIKLSGSVCFHRACPKILVFQSVSSRITSFFLVLGYVINHSKRNSVFSPLHRNDLSCQRWRGNLFIEKWPQDFHECTFCVTFEIWLFQWQFPIKTTKLTGSKTHPIKVPFQ